MDKENYKKFALVREMLEVPDIIRNFKAPDIKLAQKKLLITGEGSSRIFPGKNLRYLALRYNLPLHIEVEGGLQSMDYNLADYSVFVGSNSGKTAECVVFSEKHVTGNKIDLVVTAQQSALLSQYANVRHVLSCGDENAVAATKSVVEQALVYETIVRKNYNLPPLDLVLLADEVEKILHAEVPSQIVESMKNTTKIYWSGRNTGVAEELALKTLEITRKEAQYLEGTLVVHGIEEAMKDTDCVLLVDSFNSQFEKIQKVIEKDAHVPCLVLNTQGSPFPDFSPIQEPNIEIKNYLNLITGWRLLVEIGMAQGVDLDTPTRARKVGNEFIA